MHLPTIPGAHELEVNNMMNNPVDADVVCCNHSPPIIAIVCIMRREFSFLTSCMNKACDMLLIVRSPPLLEQVRMFRPVSSSVLQQFIGWINGTPAEYIDTKRPAISAGRYMQ